MYFKNQQISDSFSRLASRNEFGKSHLERTSSILYFLSFDSVCKIVNANTLDFNPDKLEGKNNRKAMELAFAKFVLVDKLNNNFVQVIQFGKFNVETKEPEHRISSNFLTVPLKKASQQTEAFHYPKRPDTPLMSLGMSATGLKWGLTYHIKWKDNLPKLFSDFKESTPFTDLAIFLARDSIISNEVDTYEQALQAFIMERFTDAVSKFWIKRIVDERILVRHIKSPFTIEYEPLSKKVILGSYSELETASNERLKEHVKYLEGLLDAEMISYKKI